MSDEAQKQGEGMTEDIGSGEGKTPSDRALRDSSPPYKGESRPLQRGNGFLRLIWGGLALGVVMALITLVSLSAAPGQGGGGGPTPIPDLISAGQAAPDFTAVTVDGETISLSDYAGQPVAVNFWATWCAPCRVEMPELESAQARHADEGLVILAVNVGEDAETVSEFVDELGLTFPAVLDHRSEVADLYEIRVFPTTIWIDPVGNIGAEHYGPLTEALIEEYVHALLESGE